MNFKEGFNIIFSYYAVHFFVHSNEIILKIMCNIDNDRWISCYYSRSMMFCKLTYVICKSIRNKFEEKE